MRSVSLFLPAGLRKDSGASHAATAAPDARARPESGIGIVLDQTADGRLVVEHVWPGSPAANVGICIGDVLLLIDGMQGSVSSVDVAKDLIRGAEGTMVTLQVLRGITQLEFGPIPRMDWLTMQQVI
jgi:C-terminal processing protease CtpA/Prc